MLKALLKKQFLELNSFYFQSRKTGKRRSKGGTVGTIALYALLFIFVAAAFATICDMLAEALIPGMPWLYYTLCSLMALALGVFGSVFNTYSGLYMAKDNDLLLSLPIPPRRLLAVRMAGVYAMSLLYTAIIWVPSVIVGWLYLSRVGSLTALAVILPILLLFVICLLVLTLACVLGWVVAVISSRLKNKSLITVLVSLVAMAVYYWFCIRLNPLLQELAAHADSVGTSMKTWAYPLYLLGQGAMGKLLPFVGFLLFCLLLLAVCYLVLSKSFLRIVTRNRGTKKAVYREAPVKTAGVGTALLRREWQHFLGSPTYMLNCGLGSVIMLVLAVFGLIKMGFVHENLLPALEAMPELAELVPVIGAALVGMMAATNAITAPSISLEGKSLWQLQSLPVTAWEVFQAKIRLNMQVSGLPALLCSLVLVLLIQADFSTALFICVWVLLFVSLCAAGGLAMNLLRPNLTWTNEAVPIKQGLPLLVVMFGGWLLCGVQVLGGYLLRERISGSNYLLVTMVVLALLNRLLQAWLLKRGTRIFEQL